MAAVKLDENIPDSVGGILRAAGHDVALARDEGLVGADDERVLAVASQEGRALISLDKGFANILRHLPQEAAGIVVIRLQSQTLSAIRATAGTLGKLLAESSVGGRLWVLDEGRLRIWPRDGGPQARS